METVTWLTYGWIVPQCVNNQVEEQKALSHWLIFLICECGAINIAADRLVLARTMGCQWAAMETRVLLLRIYAAVPLRALAGLLTTTNYDTTTLHFTTTRISVTHHAVAIHILPPCRSKATRACVHCERETACYSGLQRPVCHCPYRSCSGYQETALLHGGIGAFTTSERLPGTQSRTVL